jgi:hypothetical protein
MSFSFLKNKQLLIGYAIGFSFSLIMAVLLYIPHKEIVPTASAFSYGIPFGGPSTRISYDCCYGIIVTMNNYADNNKQIDLMFYWGLSSLYANYMIETPRECILGDAAPGGLCLKDGEECEGGDTTDGTITIVGTTYAPTSCQN